jgi:G3E family GTPase
MRVSIVVDLGGARRLVHALADAPDDSRSWAYVADSPEALPGRSAAVCLRLRGHTIAAGPSGETRLDLAEALRALAIRRLPPTSVVVVVGPSSALDTVQTVLEEGSLGREVVVDGVIAAVDARQASARLAAFGGGMTDAERASLGLADRVAVTHSRDLTDAGLRSVRRWLAIEAPFATTLVPVVQEVHREDVVGLDAWTGLHAAAASDAPPSAIGMTLQVAGPIDGEALDRWSDELRDDLGDRLWRLQGRVHLSGEIVATDCVGMRSFLGGSPATAGTAGRVSTVTIIGAGLSPDHLRAGFERTAIR